MNDRDDMRDDPASPIYETVEPNAASLIESLRDIGYTLSTALADIIDNSLTAKAGRVSIRVHEDREDSAIGIVDDGQGMTADELMEAMRPGSLTPTARRDDNDLGRFGLGLKTASFSQCRRLTVVTRKDGTTSTAVWDLDLVVARNSWIVERRAEPGPIRFVEDLREHGTLVLWEKLDRANLETGSRDMLRQVDEACRDLELVFHRFMKAESGHPAVKFEVNGNELVPCDPFAEWHEATIRQPVDRREIAGGKVTIQPFILPHRNKVKSDREWKRMGLGQGHMRSQGFYLYRNRRLIRHATWFRIAAQQKLTQLARVRVDIGNDSDSAWKIDVLKASASPPPGLRNHFRQLIETLGGRSKRVYEKRGAKLTDENPFPLWQRTKTDSKINYSVNTEHPAVSEFANRLSDRLANDFHAFLRLMSASLPLEALHHDMVDSFEAIQPKILDEVEMQASISAMIPPLRNIGYSDREIAQLLIGLPQYNTSKDIIEKALREFDQDE